MHQILAISISEFYKVTAEIVGEISKLENQDPSQSIVIEKENDSYKISITEDPESELRRRHNWYEMKEDLDWKQAELEKCYSKPEMLKCPKCGSNMYRKIDRRYSNPVWYWCHNCEMKYI